MKIAKFGVQSPKFAILSTAKLEILRARNFGPSRRFLKNFQKSARGTQVTRPQNFGREIVNLGQKFAPKICDFDGLTVPTLAATFDKSHQKCNFCKSHKSRQATSKNRYFATFGERRKTSHREPLAAKRRRSKIAILAIFEKFFKTL